MYFLFSGEGPTDLGACDDGASVCEGDRYQHGPMTVIVDQVVNAQCGYSLLEKRCYGFLSEKGLADLTSELKPVKRTSPRLPGKKAAKETRYFYRNARAFARYAKEKSAALNDDLVVAILFRDSDGTASAGRGLWEDKKDSMLRGFKEEEFATGVPMIPKPKSEAWLLCALKENPYQGCESLENRSGNDDSPNSLKAELETVLGYRPSREDLCEIVGDRTVDVDRIDMPSFRDFRTRLEEVIS
ncbi:MAG: hypothetical protein HQ567_24530 [Candidatus Nealsonbacteria bacterium]|nr:hypothetical protein [Candidatus Nealsonbacteria bacterium]